MFASRGLNHPALRRAFVWLAQGGTLHDPRRQHQPDQLDDPAVGHLAGYRRQQPPVRDAVEVALQVGVDHLRQLRLQVIVDRLQGVLRRATRAEPVAARVEGRLEDRFDHQFQRGLHHPVAHRRDTQRTRLGAAWLRDPRPPDRLRPVRTGAQIG